MDRPGRAERGFTLIELSIVLVIIGLIVGGVLVGQDLIRAATVRAQITQIEKFNSAANTFFGKYGALPGDITQAAVTQFGFTTSPTRSGTLGEGDGNGELDGGIYSWNQTGENLLFWQDLSANSNLIEGSFTQMNIACASSIACSVNFPSAKIGNGSFVYVYSGYASECCTPTTGTGPNFFGISFISSITSNGNVGQGSLPALTVKQAYDMDRKVDDGLPTTGNVLAQFLGNGGGYISGYQGLSASGTSPSASTCYDSSSGSAAYSVSYQNGSNVTCGISFKMQAGD